MQSSGGIPPSVTQWHVDANGLGKVERNFDDAGHFIPESWPVALQLADLKALLTALCAVDFEHVRRPVPESAVQFLSITSGGRTGALDTNGLISPGMSPAVQQTVDQSLSKLVEQARKARPSRQTQERPGHVLAPLVLQSVDRVLQGESRKPAAKWECAARQGHAPLARVRLERMRRGDYGSGRRTVEREGFAPGPLIDHAVRLDQPRTRWWQKLDTMCRMDQDS